MAVYVDNLRTCTPNQKWRYTTSCHLIADSIPELQDFAKRLGLKLAWFQDSNPPHYDLTANKRNQAIENGATQLSNKEFVEKLRKLRR